MISNFHWITFDNLMNLLNISAFWQIECSHVWAALFRNGDRTRALNGQLRPWCMSSCFRGLLDLSSFLGHCFHYKRVLILLINKKLIIIFKITLKKCKSTLSNMVISLSPEIRKPQETDSHLEVTQTSVTRTVHHSLPSLILLNLDS